MPVGLRKNDKPDLTRKFNIKKLPLLIEITE